MAGMDLVRTAWMTGPELISDLQFGDLVEFNRENVYRHWAVVVQRENHTAYVVHLTGGDEDFGELGFPVNANRLTRSNTIADLRSKVIGSARGGCAEVKSEEFLVVARDSLCRVNNGLDASVEPLPPNVVVDRAITQLGRRKYNILFSNCEHFVKWCRYGSKRSEQASNAKSVLIGVTALSVTGSLTAGVLACALGYGACRIGNHLRHKLTRRYDLLW
uniref:LRAT domain-containing protein n=1 Tax=Plectus sambesii TaxID=2011161 RepID=A0A914V992_9BILA